MVKRIAVIGLAFRFPNTTAQTYWTDLLAGCNLVTEVDPRRWSQETYLHPDKKHPGTAYTKAAGSIGDVSGFDAAFFGISPREAGLMDPQQRVLLELAWEAIESAGMPPASLRGSDCGVYLGIASTDYAYRIADDMDSVDAPMTTGNTPSIAANRLSFFYDLHGPSIALDTACSSSMVAFHQACRAIAAGECAMALAGGISLHLHPYGFIGFSKTNMISPRGRCSVFDASADGYVRSEGGGLFLLKDYARALADGDPILAVVAGTAVNTDGRKPGLTIPSAEAQAALMRRACETAGIAPAEIDYLEAHGTGTPVGDPIEARAIGVALGQPRGAGRALPIGSVKSNMGHLETASGVAGLVKAMYVLRHRVVPATIGVQTINPNIKPDEWNLDIVTTNRPLRATGRLVIGVNSFGFGGANAHVILESAPDTEAEPRTVPDTALPLVLTGKTPQAVRDFAGRLADTLNGQPAQVLYAAAYQLAQRRQWHSERAVVFASGVDEAQARLRECAADTTPAHLLAAGSAIAHIQTGPVFVYSGNGSQWTGMGRKLLDDPVFSQTIAEIDCLFQPLAGYTLAAELGGDNGENRYAHTEIAQPALFAVQVGITRMLTRLGTAPAAVMGHSVGEVAAAWACGALSLADAVQVIYHRSRLQGLTKGSGQMTAVGLGGADTQALLDTLELPSTLHIAGFNSMRGTTVAGAPAALTVLETHLAERQIFFRRLVLDYAFHSPAMDAIESKVKQALAGIVSGPGKIPFYSTVTGAPLDGAQLGADYWWRNIRAPVQFAAAGAAALADGHGVSVEIGPHPVLRSYLNDLLKHADTPGLVIATASRDGDEPERITAAAGQVIASGARVDWDILFPHPGQHIELPAYAWQRERHWHPVSPESQGLLAREIVHPLLGYVLAQHENTWQHQLDTQSHPTLADHVVGDAVVFPGAGYAELALAAARQWQTGNDHTIVEIEELDIHAPLLLATSPSKIVRVALDAGDGRLTIKAKEQGADTGWTPYASTRVLPAPGAALLGGPALALPTTPPDFDANDHQALTSAVGLNYGPAFCAIAEGWRTAADIVIARFAPHASLADELARMHLHPALLDGAFQLIGHLLRDDPAMGRGIAFVPVKIGRLALRLNQGQPHHVHVQLRRRSPRSLTVDIALYDAQGIQIAAAQVVRFRGMRLRKQAGEHLDFLDIVATPRPLPYPAPSATIDAAALRQHLTDGMDADAASTRFSHEVEPLLEALCDCYTRDALAALAADDGTLDTETLHDLAARTPDHAGLLQHLLQRAIAANDAQSIDVGWTLARPDADVASAADIWNTLLREYPDAFPAIHALGRIGLHLPALLHGQTVAKDVCPSAVTPATIDALVLGPPSSTSLARCVTAALSDAQSRLPTGQRLSVLEVGGHAPLFATACADALDFNLVDVGYATSDAVQAEQVQRQFHEGHLHASVDLITDTVVENHARHDLIIVHAAFDTLDAAVQVLAYVRARLKPGGVLLLLGRTPAPWLDMLFGAQASWWHDADGQPHSAQQSSQDWQARLQALGLACEGVLNLGDEDTGMYALLAHLPPVVESAPADVPVTPPRGILLLTHADGVANALASTLQHRLVDSGHRCTVVSDLALNVEEAEHLDSLLHSARQRLGNVTDIVHLDGWGAASAQMSADALTQAQIHRCALAAALVQACARTGAEVTLWLLTSGVMPTMPTSLALPHAPICGRGYPEGAGEGLSALNDAALWGYGRTLINEAANCRVRLLDVPSETTPSLLTAIAREFAANDAEDEILLTATGARYAPRLRELARPTPPAPATHSTESSIRLGFEFPGQLRNLRWESVTLPPPAENQLHVRVHATGLNFRDVMYALGMLSDEAVENGFVGPTLGLEFAGIVTQVGSNVSDYQPGDAVVGFGPASFSTLTLTTTNAIARIPQGFSFEAAATVPSTFFTVYYALHHLARLQAGEKILIHGAAGGVGIAAVQYAQYCGAEIYATAGSEEKRDFLRLMGVQHIYDSRALAYADEILADTNEGNGNCGVDVVLNSLAGEAIHRNFHVLKPFGRFLELGKRDFYENTHIGLRPFRNNISYFGIDADQLMNERPDLTRRLFGELMTLFTQGHLSPLPYTVFDANEVVHAFRHMQQAQQIGKIVVTYRNGIQQAHSLPPLRGSLSHKWERDTNSPLPFTGEGLGKKALCLPANASYLVTGGLNGFGLRSAQWLAEKGAKHLILISRSGPNDDNAAAIIELQAQGVQVVAARCDVTDHAALAALLEDTAARLPPLKGIIHAAAVIEDSLALNANLAQIERNFAAKVLGARHLHALTRNTPLDFCIYYSSATTLFGNPGQSAYIAANTWLEALAAERRALGLPATCVRWGPIDDVGFLARNERIKHALQDRMGGAALASSIALQALEDMLLTDVSGLGVLELDWRALGRFLPGADAPKFADIARHIDDDGGTRSGADDIAHLLATLDEDALHAHLIDLLTAELGDILRIPAAKIDATRPIYDMGLDSLMGVELVVALENRLGLHLPVMALNENPTLNALALQLVKLLRDDGTGGDTDDEVTATVAQIAANHAPEVSEASISDFVADFKTGAPTVPPRLIL